jgi:hypothetical protein
MKEILRQRTLDEITVNIAEMLETKGFKVTFEDNYHDFKNLFATGNRIFAGAFRSLEFVLIQLQQKDGSLAGLEFHVFFFTSKGLKLQRQLSRNDFRMLKNFLEDEFFSPSRLKVLEYDPPERDYGSAARFNTLFPDGIPGVVIRISGWLDRQGKD